jgi:NAD(P)-dependent dehydrogenase (short-subunit alcohol dehydrogenase family)
MLAVLPGMRRQVFGHVINVSSAGVPARTPRFGAYIASKAALDTVSDAFQAETRSDGVRFTTIHMPLVRTPMIAPTTLYSRLPALTPEQAGHVITQAIVHRPRRLTPAVGRIMSATDWVAPEFVDFMRDRAARIAGDTSPGSPA